MKNTIFLCVGGDARQIYMSKALAESATVYTYGIDGTGGKVNMLSTLDAMTEKADVLVLPLMQGEGMEIRCRDGSKVYCSELAPHLKKHALVTGGRLSVRQIEYFSALGYDVTDYYNREELVIRNCVPTAEGALQIAMQELGRTIYGADVLIIGYGRVGKACGRVFSAMGACTSVAARRLSSLAEAENNGLHSFDISGLYGMIPSFDLIINTVPAMILDESMLEAVSKDTIIIDLASKPGGVDFEAARALNKRVIWALSLPGKAAPVTGGKIIAEAVRNILLERGKRNVTGRN